MSVDVEVLIALRVISEGMQITAEGVQRMAKRLDELERDEATGLVVAGPDALQRAADAPRRVTVEDPQQHLRSGLRVVRTDGEA